MNLPSEKFNELKKDLSETENKRKYKTKKKLNLFFFENN